MNIEESKAQLFWEEVAKEIGRKYNSKTAVMLAQDKLWANYRDKMEKKHLFRLIKLGKYMSVLDLGCGAGRWSTEFAIRCGKVVAVDFSQTFINFARKVAKKRGIGNITFVCRSVVDFSYLQNRHFDVIHLGSVLQYLNDESVEPLIEKLKSHLKEDGLLISRDTLSLKYRFFGTGDYPCIYRTETEFLNIFQKKGFSLIYMNENMFPPLVLFIYYKFPYSLKRLPLTIAILKLSLSFFETLNFILLNQKWIYSFFLNKKRRTSHMFHFFVLEKPI